MAATILNSPRVVEVSVFVVRAFVKLRHLALSHKALAAKLDELERKVSGHDDAIPPTCSGYPPADGTAARAAEGANRLSATRSGRVRGADCLDEILLFQPGPAESGELEITNCDIQFHSQVANYWRM